jgi:hypothetical protein
MLMEVVNPEPLTGDHVPFRNETGEGEGRTTGTSAPADFLPPEEVFNELHCPLFSIMTSLSPVNFHSPEKASFD